MSPGNALLAWSSIETEPVTKKKNELVKNFSKDNSTPTFLPVPEFSKESGKNLANPEPAFTIENEDAVVSTGICVRF